jgi:hypothetical protein
VGRWVKRVALVVLSGRSSFWKVKISEEGSGKKGV